MFAAPAVPRPASACCRPNAAAIVRFRRRSKCRPLHAFWGRIGCKSTPGVAARRWARKGEGTEALHPFPLHPAAQKCEIARRTAVGGNMQGSASRKQVLLRSFKQFAGIGPPFQVAVGRPSAFDQGREKREVSGPAARHRPAMASSTFSTTWSRFRQKTESFCCSDRHRTCSLRQRAKPLVSDRNGRGQRRRARRSCRLQGYVFLLRPSTAGASIPNRRIFRYSVV